ncbi:MAG: penicillin-binding protein 1C, partial [Thiothrix sp.]
QWLRYGPVISGGSTITMQVARILEPHERTVGGKVRQVFRALQLEWHYSKDQILTFYLNLAPFGGVIEGVQAASFAWLRKSADALSHAEAALLAVLPQAPSRLRPDRYPERARQYRDKVLQRLADRGIWDAQVVQEALEEPVTKAHPRQPFKAPLFAQRMKAVALTQQQARLQTSLDANIQWVVENVLRNRLSQLPDRASAAVLVVENQTGYVRAYAGSADFHNKARAGHVDMVQAVRSPGSTLKPFLYGMAIDDGWLHSASLLSDVPIRLQGYAPRNFFRQFAGAVSVAEALQQSLNVPAVTVLQRLQPANFVARLRNAGVTITFPEQAEPNLSVILGGAGTTLEDLVRGFTALARGGVTIKPRFTAQDAVEERRLLSAGAAWIIQTLLQALPPPEGSINRTGIAWKTGTSYGFRDAWAVGVNDDYTVGVWAGRP